MLKLFNKCVTVYKYWYNYNVYGSTPVIQRERSDRKNLFLSFRVQRKYPMGQRADCVQGIPTVWLCHTSE